VLLLSSRYWPTGHQWSCFHLIPCHITQVVGTVLLNIVTNQGFRDWEDRVLGLMIGFIDTSITIVLHYNTIIRAHYRWLPKTRPIPSWITSVFSSTVTGLVLIYESVTSSASVVRWLTLHSWTLNHNWILTDLRMLLFADNSANSLSGKLLSPESESKSESESESESESYITTDGQSASQSWNKAPI
jgi:hypothetical protein